MRRRWLAAISGTMARAEASKASDQIPAPSRMVSFTKATETSVSQPRRRRGSLLHLESRLAGAARLDLLPIVRLNCHEPHGRHIRRGELAVIRNRGEGAGAWRGSRSSAGQHGLQPGRARRDLICDFGWMQGRQPPIQI